MKKMLLLFVILFTSCDNEEQKNHCIDPEKWGEITACPQHINYVCGCDDVTYDNECFAKVAGVVHWTVGECK